jgi:hypothetical protein
MILRILACFIIGIMIDHAVLILVDDKYQGASFEWNLGYLSNFKFYNSAKHIWHDGE